MTVAHLVRSCERVVAIGIDTATVADAQASLRVHGEAYLRRVCSRAEAAALPAEPEARAARLTGLWAAKEAVTKTLAPGPGDPWSWVAIDVAADGTVRLAGPAAARALAAGIDRVAVHPIGFATPGTTTVVAVAVASTCTTDASRTEDSRTDAAHEPSRRS